MPGHRTRFGWWIAGAALTSVLLRLPYLRAPLSVDEAGALTVARSWRAGQRLYVDTFVDRPQGVVAAFERWDDVLGPSTAAVRALAMLAGLAVVLGCAVTARAASGRWSAAAVAAWIVAVVSSCAAIEGYAANGELLAGAATVPAMAIGALVVVRRLPPPWLVAAGALGATGLTVKQSAFDVLVALGVWILVAGWRRWRPPGEAVAMAAWLALGAGAVLGAAAWHGASLGWDSYTYALYGFRLHARSAVAGPQGGRMALTLLVVLPLLGPAVVLAVRRLRSLPGPLAARLRPEHVLLLLWTAIAAAGFFAGGNYHRHYWIQLAFPVATAAAVALTSGPGLTERQIGRTTALALVVPLAISLALIARPSWERDPRVDADAAIARWYREHRASPVDDLLPLCASVTSYPEVGALPRTPYLWVDHVRSARGALPQLVALLEGADRPAYLAMHQPAATCDPTGQLDQAIVRHYREVATVDGVDILEDSSR
ncbi:hypothetical protein ACE2AJ_06010 [Aquihabitans daechungensis]|uniref:hypothetical protein n=1 Tax=Aquihabitans daechungensis TaxID=1052257 RepID=UPI003BA25A94